MSGRFGEGGVNDFEEAVFREHPSLRSLKQRLIRLGANPAMMSGSGSRYSESLTGSHR